MRNLSIVRPCQARDGVEKDDYVLAVLHQSFRLLDDHFTDLHVPRRRLRSECGTSVLYARARRVMESRRMTTSWPYSTSRFAFSMTISLTCTCRDAGSDRNAEPQYCTPVPGA